MTHLERALAWLRAWYNALGIEISDLALTERAESLAAEFAAVEAEVEAELLPQADAVGWALKEMNIALQRAQAAELRAEALKALEPIALAHKNESQRRIVWQCADAIRLALNHQEVP